MEEMTHPRSMSALLRTIAIALLVVALPLATLASVSASISGCCSDLVETPEGRPDGCCPTSSEGDAPPGSGCATGDDGGCQCPSCQEILPIGVQGASVPLPLAGAHSPDDVRIPPTGAPSGIFRPPLA